MADSISIPIPTKPDLAALRRSFQSIKTALNDLNSSVSDITSDDSTSDTSALLLSSLGSDWKETLNEQSPFVNELAITYTYSSSTITQTMAKADVINNVIILTGTVTSNCYLYLYWTASRGSKKYTIINNLQSATNNLYIYINSTIKMPIYYTSHTLRSYNVADVMFLASGTLTILSERPLVCNSTSTGITYEKYASGKCFIQVRQTDTSATDTSLDSHYYARKQFYFPFTLRDTYYTAQVALRYGNRDTIWLGSVTSSATTYMIVTIISVITGITCYVDYELSYYWY